eukprot:gnl/MRDRNA2_/MRDRNA2_79334_c0_seq1.p1 gnl/MRDRNA2_/MRDRNA2_79334_c0~~gnl/MRDRNA2_/MRDRNA2_79334_c0_seq1.p1  ORF type:complete len:172 (+),score=23.58 gnl/MRDRNA2_/MRDRNA2_79334_c0_seq1:252-767(+)
MIFPDLQPSGESKHDYCTKRGWGGGWRAEGRRDWRWWPNTLNAYRVCIYLEELDAKSSVLSQREQDQRGHALVKKFYELTYERDCNISTPEGAAVAIEELGFGKAAEVVEWLKHGGGQERVIKDDINSKRNKNVHGVPHFVVLDASGSSAIHLSGAQQSNAFLSAFSQISQ